MKDESIDVVHVCTPNVSHAPITVAAFEAGKHVLCENQCLTVPMKPERRWKHGENQEKDSPSDIRIDSGKDRTLFRACRAGELGDIYFAKAHAVRRNAFDLGSIPG